MLTDNAVKFLDEFKGSLDRETFVKLTLGNYKGADEHLQKINVRLVKTRKGVRLFFLYRRDTRETANNYDREAGLQILADAIETGFSTAHLFTTENDFQLEISKKGKSRLNIANPTFKTRPPLDHNREKKSQIDPQSFYLKALGITDDSGRVRDREQNKWKQINKFVEVLAGLVDKSSLSDRGSLRIVDMGSGKGYLTFAAYDYFKNHRGVDIHIVGVDTKTELVELCNSVAAASGFDALEFVVGTIDDYEVGDVDILIALHACNTATDDAIYKGITAGAELIVAAPCCHQELRPQIRPPTMLRNVLKHGVMLERMAETLTDGLRSLLLEQSGYATKLFEFVSIEHTGKNIMLVGTRRTSPLDASHFDQQINEIKSAFAIRHQRLDSLLTDNKEHTLLIKLAGDAASA
ncbi:MAG: SAM-dependent methyltransferase [Pyrinomonadaceae bacterium]